MRTARTVAVRELRGFFLAPLGYIAVAAFLFVYGVLYAGAVMTPGQVPSVDIGAMVMMLPVVMVLLAPLLTMRSLAGDRAAGVDLLYRSLPCRTQDVVWGKFFAVAALFFVMVAASLVYPLFAVWIGGTADAKAFFAYVAFFCLGLAYLAIGVCFSAATDSPAASAVTCFIFLFFLQGLGRSFALAAGNAAGKVLWFAGLGATADAAREALTGALLWINPATKLALFTKGIFRLVPILFFASAVVVALAIASAILECRAGRRDGGIFRALCFALCLLAANALVDRFFDVDLQWDVTASRVFSLSDESRGILARLEDPILIWGFFDEDPDTVENDSVLFLRQYVTHGRGLVEARYENPERDLSTLAAAGLPPDLDPSGYVFAVVNRRNGRYKLIKATEILTERRDLSGEAMQMLSIEQAFSGAIHSAAIAKPKHAYLLRGHGEEAGRLRFSRLLGIMNAAGYDVGTFDLALGQPIPEDAELLVMLEPTGDPGEAEAERLAAYLGNDGHLLVLCGFSRARFPVLNSELERYGVEVTGNRLMETHRELRFADDPFTFVAASPDSDVSPGAISIVAVTPREIRVAETIAPGLRRYNLLQSSNGSVAQPEGVAGGEEDKAIRGIGVAVERVGGAGAKLAVLGTSETFADTLLDRLGSYSATHRRLAADLFAWFAKGDDGVGLAIYAKGVPSYAIVITRGRVPALYFSVYSSLAGLPLLILAVGAAVYRMRRRS
ncbi:MAG: Gldg family protein [Planctomycetota bacterium]|nr:Gldg family protein [Planctomycetota bacterium]